MREMWSRIVTTVRSAFVRTPVEVMIAIATALATSAVIEDWIEPEVYGSFLISAVLLLLATFAASSLHALKVFDGRTRWALTGVFGAAIVTYGALWLDVTHLTEAWRFGFLFIAAVMAITLTPVAARLGEATASERFWRFNTRLIFRVAIAVAYAALLFGGVSLGMLAIDELFDLAIKPEVYAHLFTTIGIGLGSILAVGSLGNVAQIDRPYSDGEMVWFGRLGTFLFVPLLLFYVGILYLYLGKVMVTGDIPSNLLSPLALGAGILGYAGIFALQPFLKRDDHRPLAFVLKAFPTAFIPLVPMGIWAVAERIGQYGWTEFRYARIAALVCLGVFSIVGTVRWIRGRDFSLTFGPAIVGIVAFAGAVGPWGASYVSHASQQHRLVEQLAAAELMDGAGQIASPDAVRAADARGLQKARETARYILETHGPASMEDLTDVDLTRPASTWDQLAALGFEPAPSKRYVSFNRPYDEPARFRHAGTFTDFSVSAGYAGEVRGAHVELEDQQVHVSFDGTRASTSLGAFVAIAEDADTGQEIPEHLKHFTLTNASGPAGELALRSVQMQQASDGTWAFQNVSGYVNVWDE